MIFWSTKAHFKILKRKKKSFSISAFHTKSVHYILEEIGWFNLKFVLYKNKDGETLTESQRENTVLGKIVVVRLYT